jgi:amino acid transporter
VIPANRIDLTQGVLVAYRTLWQAVGLPWLGNVMAAMVAFGVVGQISVLIAGSSTGLLTVGKAGYLPPALQKTNSHGIPVTILVTQGIIVTALCVAFSVLPSVQSAYQLLTQMATVIYLVMYLIMYVAFIRLRHTQPAKVRPFRVPGGNFGMWLVALVGLAGALTATVFSFIPPEQISTGNPFVYVGFLLIVTVIFVAAPFVVYGFHKPTWRAADSDFEPFDRE